MNKKTLILVLTITAFIAGYFYFALSKPLFNFSPKQSSQQETKGLVNEALAAKFDYLSKHGNSSCSGTFRDSIASMPIEAKLAKKLMADYDSIQLSAEEQKAYDYAMQNSDEKGPCCCKCWRWNVYGGLGKILIKNYKFTGQQVTQVWNLSDGCGGDSEHHHAT
ncbi:MAG: hypothetical protein UY06_C0018G0005 [Candidatus Amesbacteria bacterium GW2011_GWA2_47_70]|nr:MAG: hypothetical protein UY06_C0018G0005 [Candidatus Amesbacteria bacterium GW2011_GWA2_47_70]